MYEVRFYTGEYPTRQRAANADGCIAYVEQHFNSSTNRHADYSLAIVGSNASETSKRWGRDYARRCAEAFETDDKGILVGGYNGRGNGNLVHTAMPAILCEPLFASTPRHAEIIRSEAGQAELAQVLADSIRASFPAGGLIAFSVGHKGRPSKPRDLGATVVGGGAEADYAEPVLVLAKQMLEMREPARCPCCNRPL